MGELLTARPIDSEWTVVSSFSGASHGGVFLASARSVEHCAELFADARRLGLRVSFRGGGCSYSDSIINRDGLIIDTTALCDILDWNPKTGRLRAQSGVTIADILRRTLRDRWVPASVPGSFSVTVGGAIAHNVHGKDAGHRGNFGNQVVRLTLLNGRGKLVQVDRERAPELFLAVIGGLGLFGLIVEAELQLVPVPSPQVLIETRVSRSMAETLANLEEGLNWDYDQVWVDAFVSGKELGRSITKLARYVDGKCAALDAELEKSLSIKTDLFGFLPARYLWRAGRPMFLPPQMRLVNLLYYQKAVVETRLKPRQIQAFSKFYFFHNNVRDFYSVYRPPGYLSIQALFPMQGAEAAVTEVLRLAHRLDVTPVLSGMKRHLPDDFVLSFQGLGYSITFELPLRGRDRAELESAMHRLLAYVAGIGGRVNLSKDETLPRDLFQTMYPRYTEFWQLKTQHDPDGLFLCDLARRLLA